MELKTINIKGKEYVTVSERIKYFREKYPNYSLETEIIEITDEKALLKAIIKDKDNRIISTGLAQEYQADKSSYVNSTSYVENAETSAWGRALGNLGIGINTSIASAEEVIGANIKKEYKPAETFEDFISAIKNMKSIDSLNKFFYVWKKKFPEGTSEHNKLFTELTNRKTELQGTGFSEIDDNLDGINFV